MANRKRPVSAEGETAAERSSGGGITGLQMALCGVGALVVAIVVVGALNMGLLPSGSQAVQPSFKRNDVSALSEQRGFNAAPAEPAARVAAVPAAAAQSDDRMEQAVSAFFGFYHVNARARVEHCAKIGVDIKPFADRFKNKNTGIYDRAIAAAQRNGLTEDRLWKLSRLNLVSMVATDMAGAEERLKSGPDGACKAMNEYADQFVDNLDFKKIQPAAHGLLMGS